MARNHPKRKCPKTYCCFSDVKWKVISIVLIEIYWALILYTIVFCARKTGEQRTQQSKISTWNMKSNHKHSLIQTLKTELLLFGIVVKTIIFTVILNFTE